MGKFEGKWFYSMDDIYNTSDFSNKIKTLMKDKASLKKQLAEGKTAQDLIGYKNETMARFYSAAYHLLSRKQYVDAANGFLFLVTLNPYVEEYWIGLGMATQQYGDYDMAMNAYEMAAIVHVESPVPYFYLAKCLFAMHDRESALEALDLALEHAGNFPQYAELKRQAILAKKTLLRS